MKYSARAAPVYGAKYCKVAGESAFSATTIVYCKAPRCSKVLTIWATDDAFCPIATYTQITFWPFWFFR